MPRLASANRSLKGSCKKVSREACIEAIGGSGGVERLIDIRGPSIWGQTSLQICNDSSSETFCVATNTFSIDQMGGEE